MVKKDIDRLIYTISNQNKPNKNDIDALNGVIEYVNSEKDRLINNHRMFARIYISSFTYGIYKTNGNYQKISNNLLDVLKTPLETIYNDFHQQMNETEFENVTDLLGMSNKHPAIRTPEENENDKRIVSENAKDITEALTHYNKEDVYDRLNSLMSDLIEDYGNK